MTQATTPAEIGNQRRLDRPASLGLRSMVSDRSNLLLSSVIIQFPSSPP
jgi:hypothetical protein